MSHPIIRVENLGKKYTLSHQEKASTFRDALTQRLSNPFRRSTSKPNGGQLEEFWALKDVSFEIQQGDRVGIIGRNGAGKSTLLKILSRITAPTSGEIRIKGRVASLLEVGTGFHPELTGRENIFLNGAILGMSKAEIRRKFDEIVAFAEVEKFIDTPVKRYSSGMYVRLAFAVAAHLEPEVLIVDEVLAVGDAQFQKKCLGKMQTVANEGRTVLFVSHHMASINQLCDRVIWLNRGEVVSQGSTFEVVPKYLSEGISHTPIVSLVNQSKEVFFTRISLLDHQGTPSTDLDVRFPFTIEMEYEVTQPVKNVEMAVRIKTAEEQSIFTSVYSDNSDQTKMNKLPGRYVATVEVPQQFLMPGSYTINCAAFQFDNHSYNPLSIHDYVLQFNVCETGTKVAKYNDHRSIGVVLVDFPWQDRPLTAVQIVPSNR
jgi:lipopolysaccharide transport system ATP-binding protein